MTIGEIIRDSRKRLNMTQDEMAHAVNATKATVSRWESGDICKIKEQSVKAVCRVLMLDEWLFIQPQEVLTRDEKKVLDAYRSSNGELKAAIRKLLDVPAE